MHVRARRFIALFLTGIILADPAVAQGLPRAIQVMPIPLFDAQALAEQVIASHPPIVGEQQVMQITRQIGHEKVQLSSEQVAKLTQGEMLGLSNQLRMLRSVLGGSLELTADALGYLPQQLESWESGTAYPTLEEGVRLDRFYREKIDLSGVNLSTRMYMMALPNGRTFEEEEQFQYILTSLRRTATHLLARPSRYYEANDLVHNVIVKLSERFIANPDLYVGGASLLTFLTTVLLNDFRMRIRRKSNQDMELDAMGDTFNATTVSPEEEVSYHETLAKIVWNLFHIDATQFLCVLVWIWNYDESWAQIVALYNSMADDVLSLSTYKSRISRIRSRLNTPVQETDLEATRIDEVAIKHLRKLRRMLGKIQNSDLREAIVASDQGQRFIGQLEKSLPQERQSILVKTIRHGHPLLAAEVIIRWALIAPDAARRDFNLVLEELTQDMGQLTEASRQSVFVFAGYVAEKCPVLAKTAQTALVRATAVVNRLKIVELFQQRFPDLQAAADLMEMAILTPTNFELVVNHAFACLLSRDNVSRTVAGVMVFQLPGRWEDRWSKHPVANEADSTAWIFVMRNLLLRVALPPGKQERPYSREFHTIFGSEVEMRPRNDVEHETREMISAIVQTADLPHLEEMSAFLDKLPSAIGAPKDYMSSLKRDVKTRIRQLKSATATTRGSQSGSQSAISWMNLAAAVVLVPLLTWWLSPIVAAHFHLALDPAALTLSALAYATLIALAQAFLKHEGGHWIETMLVQRRWMWPKLGIAPGIWGGPTIIDASGYSGIAASVIGLVIPVWLFYGHVIDPTTFIAWTICDVLFGLSILDWLHFKVPTLSSAQKRLMHFFQEPISRKKFSDQVIDSALRNGIAVVAGIHRNGKTTLFGNFKMRDERIFNWRDVNLLAKVEEFPYLLVDVLNMDFQGSLEEIKRNWPAGKVLVLEHTYEWTNAIVEILRKAGLPTILISSPPEIVLEMLAQIAAPQAFSYDVFYLKPMNYADTSDAVKTVVQSMDLNVVLNDAFFNWIFEMSGGIPMLFKIILRVLQSYGDNVSKPTEILNSPNVQNAINREMLAQDHVMGLSEMVLGAMARFIEPQSWAAMMTWPAAELGHVAFLAQHGLIENSAGQVRIRGELSRRRMKMWLENRALEAA